MLGLWTLFFLVTSCQGKLIGTAPEACTLKGTFSAQKTRSPYNIIVPATSTGGTNITVKINGSKFTEFILHAEDKQGLKYGKFSSSSKDAQAISCNSTDDSITHTSNSTKQSVSVTWTAPAASVTLTFKAFVAFNETTYWIVNSKSHSVKEAPNTTVSTSTQPNQTATTTAPKGSTPDPSTQPNPTVTTTVSKGPTPDSSTQPNQTATTTVPKGSTSDPSTQPNPTVTTTGPGAPFSAGNAPNTRAISMSDRMMYYMTLMAVAVLFSLVV